MTSKDGPVCAVYRWPIGQAVVDALRVMYPAQRVWLAPSTAAEVEKLGLEVLTTVQDTEQADAYRVAIQGERVERALHRRTLRGLVRRGAVFHDGTATGEATSMEEAEQLAREAYDAAIPKLNLNLRHLLGLPPL
ncbi:hypothetical protein [Deinococcus sp. UR1]|uniref:hypothetical protein n=1 Tax=Deinococcus sp. UR1 TaxID=1704277 RepID=UPI0011AF5771|nr:hypothetical protein [Deinococcus sp. UR1]